MSETWQQGSASCVGTAPTEVVVGWGEQPKRSLLLKVGLEVEKKRSQKGGDLGTWSPKLTNFSQFEGPGYFLPPCILFHECLQLFGAVFTRVFWLNRSH